MVFGLFKENHVISFDWKLCKMNILRKLHAWEKFGSQAIAKNDFGPMRF